MANRFWVGGSDNWNSTAGSKWATSSGGTGGAAVPTSSDDVFFDVNSGASNVTVAGNMPCKSLNCAGFTGSMREGAGSTRIDVYDGDVTLSATMGWAGPSILGPGLRILGTTNLTTNGVELRLDTNAGRLTIEDGAHLILQDDLTVSFGNLSLSPFASLYHAGGTLDANDKNVTVSAFASTGSNTRTLNMGDGIWTITGSNSGYPRWVISGSNLTLNAEGSTIVGSSLGILHFLFYGGGHAYNNFVCLDPALPANAKDTDIYGSNTFKDFTILPANAAGQDPKITFEAGSTQTILGDFIAVGIPTWTTKLRSLTPGSQFFLLKENGEVECDYLDIQDSNAGGGAVWLAGDHSKNSGNNAGWKFPFNPGGMLLAF